MISGVCMLIVLDARYRVVKGSGICEESEEGLLHLRGQPFGDAYLINHQQRGIRVQNHNPCMAWKRIADGGLSDRGGFVGGGGKGHRIFTWS